MLRLLKKSCETFPERNSFFVNENFYTYRQLSENISKVCAALKDVDDNQKLIGILIDDRISFETYSDIFGILFSGSGFVPINSTDPIERIKIIVAQCKLKTILTEKENTRIVEIEKNCDVKCLVTTLFPDTRVDFSLPKIDDTQTAYVLFTSGSTGIPKGVQITWENVNALIDTFFALGYKLDENDRFLQMFDLAFDFSIMCYFVPLCIGACVYTVSSQGIKYSNVYTTLEDHKITFAAMVPSFLSYLRPYFSEIVLNDLRYSFFCGEALYHDVTAEWAKCVPNAVIQNAYGPTEATVFCTIYKWQSEPNNTKQINGIVPIGKPLNNNLIIIVDDDLNELPAGHKGEICIGGNQLTPGYIGYPETNGNTFFHKEINGTKTIFYRSGDRAYFDADGDLIFLGREDSQIKLHGFRIELGEIEFHARNFIYPGEAAAVFYKNKLGIERVHLFIENDKNNIELLQQHLQTCLPQYMTPNAISVVNSFPLNKNGKIDRQALITSLIQI